MVEWKAGKEMKQSQNEHCTNHFSSRKVEVEHAGDKGKDRGQQKVNVPVRRDTSKVGPLSQCVSAVPMG